MTGTEERAYPLWKELELLESDGTASRRRTHAERASDDGDGGKNDPSWPKKVLKKLIDGAVFSIFKNAWATQKDSLLFCQIQPFQRQRFISLVHLRTVTPLAKMASSPRSSPLSPSARSLPLDTAHWTFVAARACAFSAAAFNHTQRRWLDAVEELTGGRLRATAVGSHGAPPCQPLP